MSTNGLGRSLGSLLEPKVPGEAAAPTPRGMGVLMAGTSPLPNRTAARSAEPVQRSGSKTSGDERVVHSRGGELTSKELNRKIRPPVAVRWGLAVGDLIMVGAAGWTLLAPATRGNASGVIVGTLLIGIAAGIGVLAATAESPRSLSAVE